MTGSDYKLCSEAVSSFTSQPVTAQCLHRILLPHPGVLIHLVELRSNSWELNMQQHINKCPSLGRTLMNTIYAFILTSLRNMRWSKRKHTAHLLVSVRGHEFLFPRILTPGVNMIEKQVTGWTLGQRHIKMSCSVFAVPHPYHKIPSTIKKKSPQSLRHGPHSFRSYGF